MNKIVYISKKSFAFTLAEILITLGIIGVIASLTIPNLIAETKKQEYVTALKKAYSTFNEILNLYTMDQGCPGDLSCSELITNQNEQAFDNFIKYFKIVKKCYYTNGCFPTSAASNIDGTNITPTTSYIGGAINYAFITADGMSFVMSPIMTTPSNWSNGKTNDMSSYWGYVWIDINGPNKKPNVWGRDLFAFYLTNGHGAKIYPLYGSDNADGTWANPDGTPAFCYSGNRDGYWGCSARIIEEGWKMDY